MKRAAARRALSREELELIAELVVQKAFPDVEEQSIGEQLENAHRRFVRRIREQESAAVPLAAQGAEP